MELIKYNKAVFQKNKLLLNDDITIDEWRELGQQLKQVEGSVQFWIGDWARFGDKKGFTGKYTDSKVYDELEDITGLERQTIKEFKWVAEKTSSARADDLTFRHHREVAKLPPEKQIEFLSKASEEKLSSRELRDLIKKAEIEEKAIDLPTDDIKILEKYDIELKLYNIWNWSNRNVGFGDSHFGQQTAELIFNLLYYYSQPGDLVWDVFAGGGLTHDVCNKFNRQCYSTDLYPKKKFINKCNVLKELPPIEPDFIFLDPPYWIQAKDEYSDDKNDLANMPLGQFYDELDKLFQRINRYKKFTLALIIANTQYPNEDKRVEPHGLKIYGLLSKYYKFEHHIIVPYSTQQYNGTQVNIAKRDKLILNLHRDLLVFKK